MAAGRTLDPIKTEGLPEKWQAGGAGFIKAENWLEGIHYSLSRHTPAGQ